MKLHEWIMVTKGMTDSGQDMKVDMVGVQDVVVVEGGGKFGARGGARSAHASEGVSRRPRGGKYTDTVPAEPSPPRGTNRHEKTEAI